MSRGIIAEECNFERRLGIAHEDIASAATNSFYGVKTSVRLGSVEATLGWKYLNQV
jgi:hypothetical protein